MNKEEIQSKLVEVISKHIQIDAATVTPDQNLRFDLGLDSLDVAEMVYEIEETFGISVSDESTEKIQKISDTVDFIYEQVNSGNQELSAQES